METADKKRDTTLAALIHLSTFSKYFFPLGNFIFPLIFWTARKQDPFVDAHARQALNFQISMFLYFVALVIIGITGIIFIGMSINEMESFYFNEDFIRIGELSRALPLLFFLGVIGFLLLALFILDVIAVITATIKASEGRPYKYPLTIKFITPTGFGINQSNNEQFNNIQNETL